MGGETPYTLSRGAHVSAGDGRCAMEWVAREVVPLALDATGHHDLAGELRALRPVRQHPSAQQAADALARASAAPGLDPRARDIVAIAASAARGRVPSQVAETAAHAAHDLGLGEVWPRVLALLDELLPGEVVAVPEPLGG